MQIANLIASRSIDSVVSCDAGTAVRDALKLLADKRIGAMPVMQHGRIAGIFSERDVIHCLAAEGASSLDKPVGDVMTAPPITVQPTSSLDDALALMTRRRIRHLPVVDDDGGAMRGFVSIGDLVKAQVDAIAHEAAAMRSYIQSA